MVPSCLPKASSCARSNETAITFLGPRRRWMVAVTCTCMIFRGSLLTTMVVVKAVGGDVIGGGGDDHLIAAKVHQMCHEILLGGV